ncbi:MAG: hypothetical protein MUC87_09770 [Bacteroidia bacterium]|jgi:hypothetical protein|nr:hypothetical protein [Bacteroidia bacterium]
MKTLYLLLPFLIFFTPANADCSSRGLSVFPGSSTVCQNAVFMLEGYGESQAIVNNLNTQYPVYLKAGSKKVKLIVLEICEGEFWLTQAILKPESELEADVRYTLHIDSLPESENFGHYSSGSYSPYTYMAVAKKDVEKPVLKSPPKEIRKTYMQYGCGPAVNVVFSMNTEDDSPVFVRTTVKNIQTGKSTVYYLVAYDSELYVGHSMCSGAFKFSGGDTFEVTFSLMDACGNATPWNGKTIHFTGPTPENSQQE